MRKSTRATMVALALATLFAIPGQMAAFLHRFSGLGGGAGDPGLAAANLATAAYQDVEEAVADGYVSTLGPGEGSLGCFEDPAKGGMGVHYLKASLLDATLDPKAPGALVYELDRDGAITGLVAHEYIVPVAYGASGSTPIHRKRRGAGWPVRIV